MIRVFHSSDDHWQVDSWDKPELPSRDVWIDLVSPPPEEISQVQKYFSIETPSRAEMHESEATSRLYQGKWGLFHDGDRRLQPRA